MYIQIYSIVRFLQRKLIQTKRISRERVFILFKWLIILSSAPLEDARAACLVSRLTSRREKESETRRLISNFAKKKKKTSSDWRELTLRYFALIIIFSTANLSCDGIYESKTCFKLVEIPRAVCFLQCNVAVVFMSVTL